MSFKSNLQLVVLDGPAAGRTIPLDAKNLKLGREIRPGGTPPKDSIWIEDPTISRLHIELKWDNSQKTYLVMHRSKTNLTRINGQSIDKYLLKVGDRIGMGSGLLEVQRPDSFQPSQKAGKDLQPGQQKCPRDRTTLAPTPLRNQVVGMSCSYCNGVWLSAGDLARVHGHSQDLEDAIEVEARGQGLRCPHCDLVMGACYLPNSGGLDVVRCRRCQGVWFDTDGLKLALGAIRRSHGAAPLTPPVEALLEPSAGHIPPSGETPRVDPEGRSAMMKRLKRQKEEALGGNAAIPPTPPPATEIPNSLDLLSAAPTVGASTIELLDGLLKQAVETGASDIHFEGVRDQLRIRMRVDGQLRVVHLLPKANHSPLVARLQVLSNLNTANPWIAQDGHFSTFINGLAYDFRVATVPTDKGTACVVRLLDRHRNVAELDDLGMHPHDLELFQQALERPQGMILATGPSGSGKTTTLYAAIQRLASRNLKVVTIEDPIEYQVDQVVQVAVNHKVGLDFEKALRAALRMDPDAILVGEIRDRETADIAVQASLTGHLLLSTLHTRGTVETLLRLVDMGCEPYLVKEVVSCAIAQRLVRVLCARCKEAYHPYSEEVEAFISDSSSVHQLTFYRPRGCEECSHTGYRGRTAVSELMANNDAIRAATQARLTAREIREVAIRSGMRSFSANAFDKVSQGLTSLEEVKPYLVP
ncbi:MAG: Flp pilus assembly complex ATPase component TadA [Candidatus Eremiobacteraeota bacterium]|nr:Flp pilus assembly complex ATPase component TadA [Candidatus Eremiobacteraeota bacterium]MCW5871921.1 Flp pilus assembly complex ATPase component TadA [Candidatus Eremiobacteraeota bacterium]